MSVISILYRVTMYYQAESNFSLSHKIIHETLLAKGSCIYMPHSDMPKIFTEENRDEIRLKLLDKGFKMLKKGGLSAVNIDKLT